MNLRIPAFAVLLLLPLLGRAQVVIELPLNLQWMDGQWLEREGQEPLLLLDFEGAGRWEQDEAFPILRIFRELDGVGTVKATLEDAVWENWPGAAPAPELLQRLPANPDLRVWTAADRDKHTLNGYLMPLRRSGQQWQRLASATIRLTWEPHSGSTVALRGEQTEESVLASGKIYKLAVSSEGIYRLSYDFLKNTLKMPVDQIDPRRIHLYGNGGAMLPRPNAAFRHDDLAENAIWISGQEDGVFHSGDFILFYAPGPHPIRHNLASGQLNRETNLYDTKSYYFLKVEDWNGLRLEDQASLDESGSIPVNAYDQVQRLEDELVNLLDDFVSAQGSGSRWFGDRFSSSLKVVEYGARFDQTNLVPGHPVQVRGAFASRSDQSNRFTLQAAGASLQSGFMTGTDLGKVDALYARASTLSGNFVPSAVPFPLTLTYTASGTNAAGWLDFLELQMRKYLVMSGSTMRFTDLQSLGEQKSTYSLTQAPANLQVWDITDPLKPRRQEILFQGGIARFTRPALLYSEYLAWDVSATFPAPEYLGEVPNQNLHGLLGTDMLIVFHPDFQEAAQRLADHRRTFSGLRVALAPIQEVFNEFASGSRDPFAIRDLARMIYQRDPDFRYLLLIGDASFDHRNRKGLSKHGDFVPVFETDESLDPINAFPTDDLYGLMGDEEGGLLTGHSIDIAIGRLPVETASEANQVVEKIIRYDLAPQAYGDWRLRTVFLADDEDLNLHVNDADALAESLQAWVPELNLDKIYLDAYKQIATPGGQRYPDANKAFNNAIFKGALLVNFLGHGGVTGWTQERVVQIEDILGWNNAHRLPLFLTATCTFAAFDNPAVKSGGEHVLLNPNGGGIALYSTVRPVYASLNKDLANRTLQELFADNKPWEQPIGEILRRGKNKRSNGLNERKFLLLGDPAQYLAYPRLRVVTTHLNGKEINSGAPADTLKALQTVTVEGRIEDHQGQPVQDFQGILLPTVFDKAVLAKTLGQDPRSFPRNFRIQKNILAKGAATVENGQFSFTFTLPQDIIFQPGQGKISYYAWDEGTRDAAGAFEDFIIYGVDETVDYDEEPPVVDVYMNGPDWARGGLTSDRPQLYVELYDDSGFNISGTSIGQDAIAILNEDTRQTYILNDFFEPVRDDFRRGVIRYPLQRLEPGRYTIRVRAWDIFNNPGEGDTEFVVGRLDDGALAHILNYPNPVTDITNFRFEHNLAGQTLNIRIEIYDMQGRLVKTLEEEQYAESNRISTMSWDGMDGNGRPLAAGIYLYKLSLRAMDGLRQGQGVESKLEKLVLLK
jgi:hypothetical protein